MASKAARKAIYLKNNTHLVLVTADNLSVNETQLISQGLRSHSTVVMGKNAWMRSSIAVHAPTIEKPAFVGVIPYIVGMVLTDYDPEEVSEAVAGQWLFVYGYWDVFALAVAVGISFEFGY
ncbi:large ribosomal subunit protein uL10z-like [Bidens hawaiensis]|uniref:large ribosomal subunit protein uL10z-like n=1 Tax=Bidens hawaiensis TaxID=980011 RepID=UPI004049B1F2